jgi:hypothetical protein
MAVDGQRVKLVGFMYPLEESASMKAFCLLRTTQTCCYGPRPQFNQYVLVETSKPVKFERFAPVTVKGQFFVDPKPKDGYIYRIEAAAVRSASGNDQPPGPQEVARQAGLPLFDFDPLEQVKSATTQREEEIARLLIPLDGKPAVLHGFLVGKTKDTPPKLKVGKYAWDGKAVGTPPGLYNTVLVSPRSDKEFPPLWWQEAVFKGTLRVTRDPANRSKNGVVSMDDATLATNPADASGDSVVDAGLRLPLLYEILLLAGSCGLLVPGLLRTRPKAGSSNGGRP